MYRDFRCRCISTTMICNLNSKYFSTITNDYITFCTFSTSTNYLNSWRSRWDRTNITTTTILRKTSKNTINSTTSSFTNTSNRINNSLSSICHLRTKITYILNSLTDTPLFSFTTTIIFLT